MANRRKLTNREKKIRAETKKRLQEFNRMKKDRGEHEYKFLEQYNYIKDILEA